MLASQFKLRESVGSIYDYKGGSDKWWEIYYIQELLTTCIDDNWHVFESYHLIRIMERFIRMDEFHRSSNSKLVHEVRHDLTNAIHKIQAELLSRLK